MVIRPVMLNIACTTRLMRRISVFDIKGCMLCKSAKISIMGFLCELCCGEHQLYYRLPFLPTFGDGIA